MTEVLVGSFGVVAAVLVVSGVAKVVTPAPTASLLATLHLPASPSIARLLGIVEITVGTAAVLVGGAVLAIAVSALYLAFAVVVAMARRAGAPSCGCFGAGAAPPNQVHVWVNLVLGGRRRSPPRSPSAASVVDLLGDQPAGGVPFADPDGGGRRAGRGPRHGRSRPVRPDVGASDGGRPSVNGLLQRTVDVAEQPASTAAGSSAAPPWSGRPW